MSSEVPPDFDVPWSLSDVVLRTNNCDGKVIHAYKAALAMFSPYFRVLLFGDFKEGGETSVNVDCDYDVMVEILRNIHQIGFNYIGGQQTAKYSPELLVKMYKAADLFDFAFIRKLCVQHMEAFASIEMAKAAATFELHESMMTILLKLEKEEVEKFLTDENLGYRMTKSEFIAIYQKIFGKELTKWKNCAGVFYDKSKGILNLEGFVRYLKNPRVDLTKPWPTADFCIVTNDTKVLYANKAMIDELVPNFNKYLRKTDGHILKNPVKFVADIDEEYTTMKEILSVILLCKTNYSEPDHKLHPALLHSMYCAAREDRLDIPIIRNMCVAKLVEHKNIDALDVLLRLNIKDQLLCQLEKIVVWQLGNWIHREEGHLSYRNGNKIFAITPSQTERVFDRDLIACLIHIFKMNSEVPPDFNKPWSMSDVVLLTKSPDGKEIHACKAALALFSPYFRVLFFGDFKEKTDTTVNVDCDYDAMLEILRNIHQIGYKYVGCQKQYNSDILVKMYKAADFYDFSFIRTLCLEHLEGFPSVEMANAATQINRYDILMNIVSKLDKKETKKFLFQKDAAYQLTKTEFLTIFEKIVGKALPKPDDALGVKPKEPLNLEEITEQLQNPRIDLTKPFPTADLMIITNSALGRVLYANKSVVDLMAPNFEKFISPTTELDVEGPKRFVARVDVEYTAMKEILSIFHVCKADVSKPDRIFHPALLHNMYCAAMKNYFDIPMIRSLCLTKLIEHKSIDALDVLCRLNYKFTTHRFIGSIPVSKMRDWIYREDGHLSYRNGSTIIVLTPLESKRLFYRNLARWLIMDFEEEFFKKKK